MAYYNSYGAYYHPSDGAYYHPYAYGAYYRPHSAYPNPSYYHLHSTYYPGTGYHPNSTPKSRRVLRSDACFRQASGYVAAIDFGTTFCSVAYTLHGEEEIRKFPLNGHHERVPNAILIEKESKTVAAFGYRAQDKYSRLQKGDQMKYIYFERTKMLLYRGLDVNRNTPVSPVNSSEQYYLVDVVAFILKYLKDQLYEALTKGGIYMSCVQFDWVVTVPAIWEAQGKQMMREAAYKAGLCSSPPNCTLVPFTTSRKLDRPMDDTPDRLSLALEPEAAGLFCYNHGDSEHHYKPRHFTVLDIGGGTMDITSYCIDQYGHICVVDKASGNDLGGTRVNEMFAHFLATIVNDPGFTQYVSVPDPQLQQQHKADLNKLIYGEFEKEKVVFGNEEDMAANQSVIHLPNTFVKFYKPGKMQVAISSQYEDVVELDGNELTIEPQKMKEFFKPAIDCICRDASCALERVRKVVKLEAVYLVGGFGGCPFVKNIVQDYLQAQYQLTVSIPIDHKLAVACGAIIFRRNPEVIWARKAETTYGDILRAQFNSSIHDPAYMMTDERGEYLCDCLFRPYIEAGDTIFANEVLQVSCIPFESNQTTLDFTIYSSEKHGIWYAKDRDRNLIAGLKKVGTLVFDLRGIPGRSKFDKEITLTIDLSQTEIQLKAHHEQTRKEVKVVFDTI